MLARASFENFKALKKVDVALSPLTIFVGKNSAGKTSVLQGIHHASLIGVHQTGEESHPANRLGALFSGRRDPRRLITLPREESQGPLRIAMTDTAGHTLTIEVNVPAENAETEPCRFKVSLPNLPLFDSELSLPGDAPASVKDFLAAPDVRQFSSAVFLHLDADVMVRPSAVDSEQPRLEYSGEGLASVLNYFAGAEPALLEGVTRDLARIVPLVRGIRTFPAQITRTRQERIVIGDQAVNRSFEEKTWGHRFSLDMGNGRIIPADLLSEGTVIALGLLVALRHPRCPRLVLVDDIDVGLHQGAQVELIRCIRTILADKPDVQVLCTTHSPDLLDEVQLDEVRVMALDSQGNSVCKRLSEHPEGEQWRKMLRTGEFWASVGEEWAAEAPADGQ